MPLDNKLNDFADSLGDESWDKLAKVARDVIAPEAAVSDMSEREQKRIYVAALKRRRDRDLDELFTSFEGKYAWLKEKRDAIRAMPEGSKQRLDSSCDLMYELAQKEPEISSTLLHYRHLTKYVMQGTYVPGPDDVTETEL